MSNRPGKRTLRQAAENELLDDDFRTINDGLFQADSSFSDAALRKLQRETEREVRVPVVPPYHMWPEGARKGNEAFINHVATLVERRAIVPADPTVREHLRRVEASRATERGYASIAIYDSRRHDPEYARKPLGLGDKSHRPSGGSIDHPHLKETTRIAEIRVASGLPNTEPLSDDIVESERFSDAIVPVDCEHTLHMFDTYEQATRFATKLSRSEKKRRLSADAGGGGDTRTLGSFVKTMRAECAMPAFCVRFLHDETIELCLHMESNAAYFAVFAFSIAEYVRQAAARDSVDKQRALRILRARVCSEVEGERKKSEKRLETAAQLLQAPLESLSNDQLTERSKMVQDEREFRALADRFLVRFEDSVAPATAAASATASTTTAAGGLVGAGGSVDAEECKIALYSTLGVFAFDKSPLLLSLPCHFLYVYFATCQCLMDAPDSAPNAAPANEQIAVRPKSTTAIIDGMALTSSVGFDFNKPLQKR